jgi:hypothetical protein
VSTYLGSPSSVDQPDTTRSDPFANKAIWAALVTVVGTGVQLLATEGFTLGAEGATLLTGAIVTLFVYAATNLRPFLKSLKS